MDWRYNTIWFDQIPKSNFYQGNLNEEKFDRERFLNVEYSILWHLKTQNEFYDLLPESDRLKYLELNYSNLRDFNGLDNLPNLKRLETHYCTKLESTQGIDQLSKLEILHINQSKKLIIDDHLIQLKKLKVLCLNDCGELEDLDFLESFKELIDFRFVNTKIRSGNLSPIVEHPTIRTAGFVNKRNFNYKDSQIEKILQEKFPDEYQDEVINGRYKTFKYRVYGSGKSD